MPITAERMLTLIEIAEKSITKFEDIRRLLSNIHDDAESIKGRIMRLNVEDEHINELLNSIRSSSSADTVKQFELDLETAMQLGAEKTHFAMNKNKHLRERLRMRIRRDNSEEARIRREEKEREKEIWEEQGKAIAEGKITWKPGEAKEQELGTSAESTDLEEDQISWLPRKKQDQERSE